MRSDTEMMKLILDFALADSRVRLASMEGSRNNVHIPADRWQDFDISYFVTDMDSFRANENWLDWFGKRLIMQKPEMMELYPPSLGGWLSYLMLFEDGNRIDLKLIPLNELDIYLKHDKLINILLDKDNILPEQPEPSDIDYLTCIPGERVFDDCCNQFWWVSTYVAKGLWRGEFLYALSHLNNWVHPALFQMLGWQAAVSAGKSVRLGKSYKYLPDFIAETTWGRLRSTFANDSQSRIWESLFECHSLFREASGAVANTLGYAYPDYDEKVTQYIKTQPGKPA